MTKLQSICEFLDRLCPPVLAEPWDNVGLLMGDSQAEVSRIMTCLTVTEATAAEAVAERASLIVSHHPLPFHPLNRLTTASPEGRCLLMLARAGIAIYSPHTAFDSAAAGINQQLAAGLGLTQIAPLTVGDNVPAGTGLGRAGLVQSGTTLAAIADRAKHFLKIDQVQLVGPPERQVRLVGVACGSAGELHATARQAGCECLVTGEARFHTCLEALATGLSLLLVGHYSSERFGVELLARVMQDQFADLTVWASRDERDPVSWH